MEIDYPWSILEIESTSEKKKIKQAYAKRLKKCRPDDDPVAFQEIHQAYKTALKACESPTEVRAGVSRSKNGGNSCTLDRLIQAEDQNKELRSIAGQGHWYKPPNAGASEHPSPKPRYVFELLLDTDEADNQLVLNDLDNLERKFNLLSQQIIEIIEDQQLTFDWKNWHVLYGSTDLLDDVFHDRMSLFVFIKLNELTIPRGRRQERDLIVKNLDLLFGWSRKRRYFEEKLGVIACSYVLGNEGII